jgi:thioesterase domain-containing protein
MSKVIDAHYHRIYDMVEEFPPVMGHSLGGGEARRLANELYRR